MLSNMLYQFSIFADYSNLDFLKILSSFGKLSLVPNVVSRSDDDGRICTGMSFSTSQMPFFIRTFPDRIDVLHIAERKEGFEAQEQGEICERLRSSMHTIENIFSEIIQLANRMAWYTEYVYFGIDYETRMKFKNRFLKDIDFYREKTQPEFMVRYVGKDEKSVNGVNERINIVTSIENWRQNILPVISFSEGYKISIDINTIWENKKNRFSGQNYDDFINVAIDIQNSVKGSVLYGCD